MPKSFVGRFGNLPPRLLGFITLEHIALGRGGVGSAGLGRVGKGGVEGLVSEFGARFAAKPGMHGFLSCLFPTW
jgi:hypothetical protein